MKNLLYIILAVNLCSCGIYKNRILNKYCVSKSIIKDSTVMNFHDTTIIIKKDSNVYIYHDTTIIHPATHNQIKIHIFDSINGLNKFDVKTGSGGNSARAWIDGEDLMVESDCEETVSHYTSLLNNEYHKVDSLSNHIKSISILHSKETDKVREPDYTWWEEFMLSSFGTIIMLIGLLCITVMGILIYKTIKSK